VAITLRLGAHCLYHAKNYFGDFYRKMKWRLGAPEAVTAAAHKLARMVRAPPFAWPADSPRPNPASS
jgi:hypothetical protein